MKAIKVWVRWRPLKPIESQNGELKRETSQDKNSIRSRISITSSTQAQAISCRNRSWESGFSFEGVIEPDENNRLVYNRIVGPTIPEVLQGNCCNFFAYGHSSSGKTHTMIGGDPRHEDKLGLCIAAARQLMNALDGINGKDSAYQFGLGLRVYELRKNSAFDLLNNQNECFVCEGPDGKVHIRGKTEVLANGKVRV